MGARSMPFQVLIKNTAMPTETSITTSRTSLSRSQSVLNQLRMPIFSPSRSERIRLENILFDVWSKDIIQFPGMKTRGRSEGLVRASAQSVIRKLSVASITSNFTKRSGVRSIPSRHML